MHFVRPTSPHRARTEHLEKSLEEIRVQCGRTDEECGRMTARMDFGGKCGRTDEVCGRTYRLKGRNLKETYSVRPHRGRTKAAQSSESRFMGSLSILG